jgi:CheY-like chemotaxis protein
MCKQSTTGFNRQHPCLRKVTAPARGPRQPDRAADNRPTGEIASARTLTADLLRDLGYEVVLAEDGHIALKQLMQNPDIDLLFTDVGLPNDMNGRQLADEACRRMPGLRVLFTTGDARNAIVHQGRLDPEVELIAQLFSQPALAEKIRRILASYVALP